METIGSYLSPYKGTSKGAIIEGSLILSEKETAPSAATDPGVKGTVIVADDAIYVCIATDTWVKADLATWS